MPLLATAKACGLRLQRSNYSTTGRTLPHSMFGSLASSSSLLPFFTNIHHLGMGLTVSLSPDPNSALSPLDETALPTPPATSSVENTFPSSSSFTSTSTMPGGIWAVSACGYGTPSRMRYKSPMKGSPSGCGAKCFAADLAAELRVALVGARGLRGQILQPRALPPVFGGERVERGDSVYENVGSLPPLGLCANFPQKSTFLLPCRSSNACTKRATTG